MLFIALYGYIWLHYHLTPRQWVVFFINQLGCIGGNHFNWDQQLVYHNGSMHIYINHFNEFTAMIHPVPCAQQSHQLRSVYIYIDCLSASIYLNYIPVQDTPVVHFPNKVTQLHKSKSTSYIYSHVNSKIHFSEVQFKTGCHTQWNNTLWTMLSSFLRFSFCLYTASL